MKDINESKNQQTQDNPSKVSRSCRFGQEMIISSKGCLLKIQARIDPFNVFASILSSLILFLFIEGFLMSCPKGWRIIDVLLFWAWMSNLSMLGIFSWSCLHDSLSLYLDLSYPYLELLVQRHIWSPSLNKKQCWLHVEFGQDRLLFSKCWTSSSSCCLGQSQFLWCL